MLIILHSLFWLWIILTIFSKQKIYSLLNPLFLIGLSMIAFFSTEPNGNEDEVGIVLIVSTAFLLWGFFFKKKVSDFRLITKPFAFDNIGVQKEFLFLCITLSLLPIIILLSMGINLFEVLTRFITPLTYDQNQNGGLAFIVPLLSNVPLWGVIVGRIWFHNTENKSVRNLWYLLVLIVFISKFSSGIRGGLLIMLLSILLTDLFIDSRMKLKVFRKNLKFYIYLGSLLIFSILFLSFFRSTKFNSINELGNSIKQLILLKNNQSSLSEDGSITTNSAISFCIDNYLEKPRYFSGLIAQVANPIPRIFWPEKPETFGKILAHEEYGSPLEGPGAIGWGGGIPGEAIFNAGYFGLVLFPFIFGLFFNKMNEVIKTSNNLLLIATTILFLSETFALIRGDWAGASNYIIYTSLTGFMMLITLRGLHLIRVIIFSLEKN